MKQLITSLIALAFTLTLKAQENSSVEMADDLRASGKIYIVVIVLCIIFIGIIGYLIAIDKKIKKLEKQIEQD